MPPLDSDPVAVISSISEILKRTRDLHQVDIPSLSLIPNLDNDTNEDENDTSNFDNSEGRSVIGAVRKYSNDFPLRQLKLVTATGSPYYVLADLIDGWNPKDWKIERIQWPVPTTPSAEENYILSTNWRQTFKASTNESILQFVNGYTLSTDFIIWYHRPHLFDVARDMTSIPEDHFEPIALLAAADMLRKAGAKASGFGDTAAGYQSKDLSNVSQRYRDQAKEYEDKYKELISGDIPQLGYVVVNWPLEGVYGRLDFHPFDLWQNRGGY